MRMSRKSTNLILNLLLLVMLFAGSAFAQTPTPALVLDVSKDELPLAGRLEILEDPAGELSFADVTGTSYARDFNPLPSSVLQQDKPWATYWLRLNLSQASPEGLTGEYEDKWVLELGWPFLAMARLYTPRADGSWQAVQSGQIPPYDPDIPTLKLPAFILDINKQKNATIYLQIKTFGGPPFPVKLYKLKQAARISKLRMLLLGLYFGILLAMALYNLSMYISLRQPSYLWYVLSVIFLAVHYFGFNGLAYEFAPPWLDPFFLQRPILTWLALSLLCVGLFTKYFLDARRNSPFSNKILNVYLAIWLIMPLLLFTLPSGVIPQMMSIVSSLFVVVLLLVGILCWRRGFKPARLFLLAWFFSALGSIIFSLTFGGVIPYSTFGIYAIQIGTALEMVFLSLALADRVRILRLERDSYQRGQSRFRDLSTKDGLTGAYNKRYLLEELPLLIQFAAREKKELSVGVLDLDDFKKYNDTYGHLEGDKVLVAFARVIKDSLREGDLVCRFGGEEFIVILPGSGQAGAGQVVERIHNSLSRQEFEPTPGETVRVTTSIGLATLRTNDDDSSFLKRADEALYKAKSRGKNQTAMESDI